MGLANIGLLSDGRSEWIVSWPRFRFSNMVQRSENIFK